MCCPPRYLSTRREVSERILVRHATSQDATFVKQIGRGIADHLNPDGLFDENDRARRRGLNLGPQGPDGMSRLSGWIDPEARAYLEAANAAVRPGRHQPDADDHQEVQPDPRTAPQRLHDAVKLGLRAGISSGEFGQHRGLPVTVIVSTTLDELNQAAHAVNDPAIPMPPPARTGGGSVPADARPDPHVRQRHSLPGGVRGPHQPAAVSRPHQTRRLRRSTHHLLRPRPRLHPPGLHRARLPLRNPPRPAVGRPAAAPTPTACSSPADPTTPCSARASSRPKSPTPADSPGPTAPAHPKSTSPTTPTNYSPNSTKTTAGTPAMTAARR